MRFIVNFLCVSFVVLLFPGPLKAMMKNVDDKGNRFESNRMERPHRVSQIIIKLKPGLSESAEDLMKAGRPLSSAFPDGSNSIDQLNQKYSVKNIRRVFSKEQSDNAPALAHIYVFEVAPSNDINAMVQDYQSDPHVEYAQPDYPVSSLRK